MSEQLRGTRAGAHGHARFWNPLLLVDTARK